MGLSFNCRYPCSKGRRHKPVVLGPHQRCQSADRFAIDKGEEARASQYVCCEGNASCLLGSQEGDLVVVTSAVVVVQIERKPSGDPSKLTSVRLEA